MGAQAHCISQVQLVVLMGSFSREMQQQWEDHCAFLDRALDSVHFRTISDDAWRSVDQPLTEDEKAKLQELEWRLVQHPVPPITPHYQERHECRLLRFLRADEFDVEKAL